LLAREQVARGATAQVLSEPNLLRARQLAEAQGDVPGAAVCNAKTDAEHRHR
jgi:hypothetical protein